MPVAKGISVECVTRKNYVNMEGVVVQNEAMNAIKHYLKFIE